MRKTMLGLNFLFLISVAIPAYAGSQKFVAYVPAPTGMYDRLRYVPRPTLAGACDLGTMYFDDTTKTFKACQYNSTLGANEWGFFQGVWKQVGDNIVLSDTANPFVKKVAIGTQTPELTLTMYGDGGIISTGTVLAGDLLTSSGGGTRLIWWPRMAAFRAGQVATTNWDAANIGVFSMGLGFNPKASGNSSAVMGGTSNTASGMESFAGGGANNTASGQRAVVLGGATNIASGLHSFVAGGGDYDVPANRNTASGLNTAVVGGSKNIASGENSIVVGGGRESTHPIGGDYGNTASGISSGILGGTGNKAQGVGSAIAGAGFGVVSGNYSFIGGGSYLATNTITNAQSAIIGGQGNIVNGTSSAIAGGVDNTVSIDAFNAAVAGGRGNTAAGPGAFIGGGYLNIAGTNAPASYAFVAGGICNQAIGRNSFVGGGGSMSPSDECDWGGTYMGNIAAADNSAIIGGLQHLIEGSASSGNNIIAGGSVNRILIGIDGSYASGMFAGNQNTITDSDHSIIIGGDNNTTFNSSPSTIISGSSNEITDASGLILGGGTNKILTGGSGVILSGGLNKIEGGGQNSVIAGGGSNTIRGSSSFVMGQDNIVDSSLSFAGGTGVELAAAATNTFVWDGATAGPIATMNAFLIFPSTVGFSGAVGIRLADPNPLYAIEIGGDANARGGMWIDGSSRDYKKDISLLTNDQAIAAVTQLEPVSFRYKNDKNEDLRIGFIAEDVPELVATKDRKSLSSMEIVAILTKVVQQQQTMIEKQQKEIETLKTRMNDL